MSVAKLVILGLSAAGLFSITFVVNRAMSLSGGHWAWSAMLRYLFTIGIILFWMFARKGLQYLISILSAFMLDLRFWLLAGGVGYALFYSSICLAASNGPGWVVAVTWQLTIIASPMILLCFGLRVPKRGFVYVVIVFAGVMVANIGSMPAGSSAMGSAHAAIPVVVAAFAYPIGNQMLNSAKHNGNCKEELLGDPLICVLLMSLGALPFLAALVLVLDPPLPSGGQVGGSLLIAFVSGTLATSLFTYARNLSADPYRISAVDATQSAEVVFAFAGEALVTGASLPSLTSCVGVIILLLGLVGVAWKR